MSNKQNKPSNKGSKQPIKNDKVQNSQEKKGEIDKNVGLGTESQVTADQKQAQTPAESEKNDTFQTSYELEDKRLEDVENSKEDENLLTDKEAIKTDGTANVNADSSLPTTEAQKGVPDEVRSGEKEQPHLNKTPEEQLGLANPDDRIAEELREAKLSATAPSASTGDAEKKSVSRAFDPEYVNSESEAKALVDKTEAEHPSDERTDDVTLPDGAQKAQERKDAQAGYEFHLQEAEKNMAEAQRSLEALKRLAPKQ